MYRKAVNTLSRALRQSSQAVDRMGLTVAEKPVWTQTYSRHRKVMPVYDMKPELSPSVFVAPSASISGLVNITGQSSVWYGAVIRGDKSSVTIEHYTNIQDRAVINTVKALDDGTDGDVTIGKYCTIGPGTLITSAEIGDRVHVGQGCVISPGCIIEEDSKIMPGSVLLPGSFVGHGQLWAGNPAKYERDLTAEEIQELFDTAFATSKLSREHDAEFLPWGCVYQEYERREEAGEKMN